MEELNRKLLEIGRSANLQADYEKTLLLLAALKAGTIGLENFELTPGGWILVTTPTAPEPPPVVEEIPQI